MASSCSSIDNEGAASSILEPAARQALAVGTGAETAARIAGYEASIRTESNLGNGPLLISTRNVVVKIEGGKTVANVTVLAQNPGELGSNFQHPRFQMTWDAAGNLTALDGNGRSMRIPRKSNAFTDSLAQASRLRGGPIDSTERAVRQMHDESAVAATSQERGRGSLVRFLSESDRVAAKQGLERYLRPGREDGASIEYFGRTPNGIVTARLNAKTLALEYFKIASDTHGQIEIRLTYQSVKNDIIGCVKEEVIVTDAKGNTQRITKFVNNLIVDED